MTALSFINPFRRIVALSGNTIALYNGDLICGQLYPPPAWGYVTKNTIVARASIATIQATHTEFTYSSQPISYGGNNRIIQGFFKGQLVDTGTPIGATATLSFFFDFIPPTGTVANFTRIVRKPDQTMVRSLFTYLYHIESNQPFLTMTKTGNGWTFSNPS
ncbi:MAG: hypothetical protein HQL66_14735 [Magnetococcales bacterium]|nr:hypothetical protein [Magnetococcales bacterium]